MHLPPPPIAPTVAGRPCGGRHPPHRKNRERRRRRGVKRRREREKKERCASNTYTRTSVRVRAERDGRGKSGTAAPITITWRAATALPTAAARATTRPLHHAARSAPVTLRSPLLLRLCTAIDIRIAAVATVSASVFRDHVDFRSSRGCTENRSTSHPGSRAGAARGIMQL